MSKESLLLPPHEFKSLSVQAFNNTIAWATLCVAVGVESGAGHIARSTVISYLAALSKRHKAAIFGWLQPLLAHRKINSKRSGAMAWQISRSMTETSVRLGDLGFIFSSSARPKEGLVVPSPFLEALLQLDTSMT
jgi:hypothetical protein